MRLAWLVVALTEFTGHPQQKWEASTPVKLEVGSIRKYIYTKAHVCIYVRYIYTYIIFIYMSLEMNIVCKLRPYPRMVVRCAFPA